jgi:predicted nuclease of restriction endonuclease-like (RecB) superfamily
MDFTQLTQVVEKAQKLLQYRTLKTVNQLLVVRNWLIGYYIVEYEQNGSDSVAYGQKILQKLAENLKKKGLKGFSFSNLKLYRQFYNTYPQLNQPIVKHFSDYVSAFNTNNFDSLEINIENTDNKSVEISHLGGDQLGKISQIGSGELNDVSENIINQLVEISQPVAGQLETSNSKDEREKYVENIENTVNQFLTISQQGAGQFKTNPELLLSHFSFRHFTALLTVSEPIKQFFYEQQTIKCNWHARQLERQIETLFYERVGLSKDKKEMLAETPKGSFEDLVKQTLKDPYIFEFTGFKELPKYSENDLETALLNKIEDFLIELGHGFCFEARQKRITIDGEHDRIDLVFYHRILKCHILIDLKTKKFRKEYVGQMIYYLNYFRENMMTEYDNPSVGIILSTDKNETMVKYATTGIDQSVFVSKYMVELPTEEELLKLIQM